MTDKITHRRDKDSTLHLMLDAKPHDRLSILMRDVVNSRSPSHRRNFLRRAMRYLNARVAQGHDPLSLFEDGTAAFREALVRWHRNESGRFAWDWDGKQVTVFWGGAIDLDMTQAVNLVLATKMLSGRRKYVDFLMSYINFEVHADEDRYDFVTEGVEDVRFRVMQWIRVELELVIDPRNGSLDSSVKVKAKSAGETINTRAVGIAGVRQLYANMATIMRLRTGPNPLDFDGWADMTRPEKAIYAKRKWPKLKIMPIYAGAQFEIDKRRWYPPIPHNPVTAGVVITNAIDASGRYFPAPLRQLLEIMRPQGNRFHDVHTTMLSAWVETDFGRYFWARNKASDKVHAKRIFIPPAIQRQMHERIDADHLSHPNPPATVKEVIERVRDGKAVWPSMAQLRELAAMGPGGLEILGSIPMFPSSRGRPYAYTTWNNYYIRPIVRSDPTARIGTSVGPVAPSPIWLRRSMYSDEVGTILRTATSEAEQGVRFKKLASDKGLASVGPIYRYANSAFPAFFAQGQSERAAEAELRMKISIGEMPSPSTKSSSHFSPAAQARRSRARA